MTTLQDLLSTALRAGGIERPRFLRRFPTERRAFTLIEIMIVLLVVGILLAIAVPGFLKAREVGRARSCQENLSKMDGAKEQYAMESNLAPGESVPGGLNDLVGPESFLKRMPFCPGGGNYELNPIGVEPTCDYAKPAFAPDHSL